MIGGLCRVYQITDDEMGKMLGLGDGQSAEVVSLKSGASAVNKDVRERVDLLNEIFGSIRTIVDQEAVPAFIRESAINARKIIDILCTGNEGQLRQLYHVDLHRLTGGRWSTR